MVSAENIPGLLSVDIYLIPADFSAVQTRFRPFNDEFSVLDNFGPDVGLIGGAGNHRFDVLRVGCYDLFVILRFDNYVINRSEMTSTGMLYMALMKYHNCKNHSVTR